VEEARRAIGAADIDRCRVWPWPRPADDGADMRELRHLILHGLVSAFVRTMPYTLLSLLKAALPNQAR
jgi:hypothetical protein